MADALPTTGLVAIAWLTQHQPAFAGIVATSLPAPVNGVLSWQVSGFVQVQELGGGTDIDIPQRRTAVITADLWVAPAPGSTKPPWHKAAQLAEQLRQATEGDTGGVVTLPTGYAGARVLSAYLISEPSRVPDDPAGYARFTADLALDWVRVQ
jgi:hypothetical protein